MRKPWNSRGFTIAEMVISVAIMMVVTGAVFGLMNPAQGVFQAQLAASEMQQRLRIGVDAIYSALLMAGAGPDSGSAASALGTYFATVLPFRRGARSPDPPGSFHTDRVSLLHVPSASPHTTTSVAMPDTSADIRVNAQPGCPAGDPLCGFQPAMTAIIFDETGSYETFRVSGLVASPAAVQHAGEPLARAYGVGAHVTRVVAATYWLKTDTTANVYQLMRYDGDQTDLPVVDEVVGLDFEYYGDAQPPALRKPVTDPKGPWTSYGPRPPPLGIDNPADTWGSGENCIFSVRERQQVTRPEMAVLDSVPGALVKLDSRRLTDGPWCPDETVSSRFDADLLRVRKIRVTLRVQVGLAALRGTGKFFAHPGTSQSAQRWVPDEHIAFDVTPRNLSFGR
jgi:hypothetical protein